VFKGKDFVMQHVATSVLIGNKIVQFAFIFHFLFQNKPMMKYEHMKYLFAFLKMPNNPSKQWNDYVG
jgi:hypothetical protein